jgi:ketosteroid isomerase-like protein
MRLMRALALTLLCVVASSARAADDPAAIAKIVGDKFAAACAAGNVAAVLALYRDDARVVYPGAGQSAAGKAELRGMVEATCRKGGGPELKLNGYRAVFVDAKHTTIASLGDWSMAGTGPDGKPTVTPVRATEVLVKDKAGWRYAVDHASVGIPLPPAEAPATPAR